MTNSSKIWHRWVIMTAGVLAVIGIAWGIWSRWLPPQLEVDGQVFNTVDALFTAIRSRDSSGLGECERKLKAYHEEGRLSDTAAGSLDVIIQQAREGQWEPAARRLYDFMRGQRGRVRTAVEKTSARRRGWAVNRGGLEAATLSKAAQLCRADVVLNLFRINCGVHLDQSLRKQEAAGRFRGDLGIWWPVVYIGALAGLARRVWSEHPLFSSLSRSRLTVTWQTA